MKFYENTSSFLMIYLSSALLVVCTLFLNKCQFIQYVNNWPFSSIEWNSNLTNKKYWLKSVCVKGLVSTAPTLILSQVTSEHFLISISSQEVREELSLTNNGPIRILDRGQMDQSGRGLLTKCWVNLWR